MTVLLLGGTAEARELAAMLVGVTGIVSSLAGRVSAPRLPVGHVRIGGFGGVDGLAAWMEGSGVRAVVDATHPFAERISANAVAACARTRTPLLRLVRPAWLRHEGSPWHAVGSLDAAAAAAARLGRRVFVTTGRQGIGAFADWGGFALIRCVDPPAVALPADHVLVLARGPYDAASEEELMRAHRIDVLVTKDSGGQHTAGKLDAARRLGIPVVVVERPPPRTDVPTVEDVAGAVAWVRSVLDVPGRVDA